MGGWVLVPLWEFVVDEITTKLHLPSIKGKSRLICKLHLPHNSQMGPNRDFRDGSSYMLTMLKQTAITITE